MNHVVARTLLSAKDPDPVEVAHADSASPVFLLCEHAGRDIPEALGDLGIAKTILDSHRGWDIGAEALARKLAERLGAPLVIQRYSRLVIDCNRPPDSPLSVPLESDHAPVPGNQAASAAERSARVEEIFAPMNAAVGKLIEGRHAAFSVHSFMPKLDGVARPWQAGFLSRTDLATARALCGHVAVARPDLTLAVNKPYRIEAKSDWFIPAHAEPRGLTHSLIEVRNDQLGEEAGIALWADLLADAIRSVVGI
ncbi:MAG: N-formylglutamate amidohydrolase [Chloroflexi bacterium]|nr:N-formylglutamate amidohydrolase [Chloroflexota bacterium]